MISECYLCGGNSLTRRSGKIRDLEGLKILECNSCSLVFLSSFEHIDENFYEESGMLNKELNIEKYRKETLKDDLRRFNFMKESCVNKKLLDFGCGGGGFLHKAKEVCSNVSGIELDNNLRMIINNEGIKCYSSIEKIGEKFDIITMFHVLEHLVDPVNVLETFHSKLSENGNLIIEVPNSNDALLSLYKSMPFSEFTYWSCHLYLFNPSTLKTVIEKAGYKVNFIKQIQRYPLSNHLYWLSQGLPGGHQKWSFLDSIELHSQYENQLAALGICDTLIASVSPL